MKIDKRNKQYEDKKRKMKQILDSYPDLSEFAGFSSSDEHIFKIIYVLIEHSQRLNRLTTSLIVLTVILAVATIVSLAS